MGETCELQLQKRLCFRSFVDSYMTGLLLDVQAQINNSFGLTVSMHPYTANGNVLFWYPISLSYPSIERTQLGPTEENVLFVFFFLSMGILFPNQS